jgi:hypothetical protein
MYSNKQSYKQIAEVTNVPQQIVSGLINKVKHYVAAEQIKTDEQLDLLLDRIDSLKGTQQNHGATESKQKQPPAPITNKVVFNNPSDAVEVEMMMKYCAENGSDSQSTFAIRLFDYYKSHRCITQKQLSALVAVKFAIDDKLNKGPKAKQKQAELKEENKNKTYAQIIAAGF